MDGYYPSKRLADLTHYFRRCFDSTQAGFKPNKRSDMYVYGWIENQYYFKSLVKNALLPRMFPAGFSPRDVCFLGTTYINITARAKLKPEGSNV